MSEALELGDIAGVIFDLDGTLYARPKLLAARMALACGRDLGLLRQLSSVRRELAGKSFDDEAALWTEHHSLLARLAGVTAERARDFYDRRFMPAFIGLLRRHATPRPGLAELVKELADGGLVCCVLSDYDQVEARLTALGLEPGLFRGCASSTASGALKPAPRSFLQLAQRFSISPGRWLVVGDRADTDGAGAAAAGMAFLGVGDGRRAGFEPWPQLAQRLSAVGRRAAACAPPKTA